MKSRERVIRAIEMTGPDRAPIMYDTLPGAAKRYGDLLDALYRRYPEDVVRVGSATYGEFGPEVGIPSRDPWGSLWVRFNDEHKGQVVFHPLADWNALDRYQPPDTATDEIINALVRRIEENAGGKYTIADGDTLWQRMYYLRGFQEANEDLLIETERAARLRDMILAVILRRLQRLSNRVDALGGRVLHLLVRHDDELDEVSRLRAHLVGQAVALENGTGVEEIDATRTPTAAGDHIVDDGDIVTVQPAGVPAVKVAKDGAGHPALVTIAPAGHRHLPIADAQGALG